jgi:hypothetical protein
MLFVVFVDNVVFYDIIVMWVMKCCCSSFECYLLFLVLLLSLFRILCVVLMVNLVLNVAVSVSNFCVLFWWILQYCRYEIVVFRILRVISMLVLVLNVVVSVLEFYVLFRCLS